MDKHTAQEVIDCLPVGKTVFNYCKDSYALFLLSQVIGRQCAVADLKRSAYASLLQKPLLKNVIAQCGDGILRREQLNYAWGDKTEAFLLTLSTWGDGKVGWSQVSRPGYSLVLQLNFNNKHDRLFKDLVKPEGYHYFSNYGHPVMQPGQREFFRETLAWARIDFDFASNEALIEELQTDWLREAKDRLDQIRRGNTKLYHYERNTTLDKVRMYLEHVLAAYQGIWDEAMLTATLQFIRQELGIKTVYLHTPDTGAAVKRIKCYQPPRSLYSNLPKRFCFQQCDQAPEFLRRTSSFRRIEKALGLTQWNVINLGETYDHITKTATEKPCRHVTLAA